MRVGDYVQQRAEPGVIGVVAELDSLEHSFSAYVQWRPHEPGGPFGTGWYHLPNLVRVPPLVALAMQAIE